MHRMKTTTKTNAKARPARGSQAQSGTKVTKTAKRPAQTKSKTVIRQSGIRRKATATHICHRCRHRFTPLTMQQVAYVQDEYKMWSQARAEHFKHHHRAFPKLVWLCWGCAAEESKPRNQEV